MLHSSLQHTMSNEFTSVQWSQLPFQKENDTSSLNSQNPAESTDLLSSYNNNLPQPTEPSDDNNNNNNNNDQSNSNSNASASDNQPSHYNITIHVTNPEMQTDGSNSYTIYHVQVKTNNPSLTETPEYDVIRRYSDFDTLHKGLTHAYPTFLIPPLPNKQRLEYIKGGRFTEEFVRKRCNSLDLFMQRILCHPKLRDASIFYNFISPKINVWNNCRLEISSNIISDPGLTNSRIEGFTEFLMNSFKKPHITSSHDAEFKEIVTEKSKLQENLHKIDKIYAKIISKQSNIANELNSFSDEFDKLKLLLNNDLNGKFRSDDQLTIADQNLVSIFKEFSNNLKVNSNEYIELNKFIEFNYLNNLKDLEHYLLSVDALFKLKDNKILDYEMLSKYLEKSIQEKDHLEHGGKLTATTEGTISFLSKKLEFLTGKNNSTDDASLISDRIQKLDQRIKLLQKEKDISRQVFDKFETDLLNEWDNFQKIKNEEIVNSLNDLSHSYLTFYEKSYTQWDKFHTDTTPIEEHQTKLKTEAEVLPYLNDQQLDKNQEEIEDLMNRLNTNAS